MRGGDASSSSVLVLEADEHVVLPDLETEFTLPLTNGHDIPIGVEQFDREQSAAGPSACEALPELSRKPR